MAFNEDKADNSSSTKNRGNFPSKKQQQYPTSTGPAQRTSSKSPVSSPYLTNPLPQPYSTGPRNPSELHAKNALLVLKSPVIPIPDRKHGKPLKKGMMDPFEVRIKFTQYLQHLNASVTSANKTALYALKYRDMDEDLHSCILEQLERNSMNNRANIMYFIEHLCDLASRENHHDYVRMMQRDILRVVDAVAPEDGSGAANVKVVRKVLNALQQKSFLLRQTVDEIEECLKERDIGVDGTGLSSPILGADIEMSGTNSTSKSARAQNGFPQKFDKKQIEQRIEEDRERHKRLRETIWAVPSVVTGDVFHEKEFEKLLDETSDLGEDDFELYAEEMAERRAAAREWEGEYRSRTTGGE